MDDVTWGALTLTLTLLGGFWTWFAYRRRGLAAGTRAGAFTLLPAAAWLTGTLEMFTEIGGAVADWATHVVLSPTVWLGTILAGLSVVLFVVSGYLRDRLGRGGDDAKVAGEIGGSRQARPTGTARPPGAGKPAIDDDLAEIEALLRKRGIT